jgi:hypothetical protein
MIDKDKAGLLKENERLRFRNRELERLLRGERKSFWFRLRADFNALIKRSGSV